MNERDWEDLLYAIEEGQVVPIVGRDLLIVDTKDGAMPFHRVVAPQLAKERNIDVQSLPQDFDTNDLACADKEYLRNPELLNAAVNRILRNLVFPPPEPLRLLAEIPTLRLFVSTTIDRLLEDTLAKVRGFPPVTVSFPPSNERLDFDEAAIRDPGSSLVFHILGLVSASSEFAVTEGQMLEQMYNFMSGAGRPHKLIAKLQNSHLLIIGVGFPSWLARFLLRIARSRPLWEGRRITEVFADLRSLQPDFSEFLTHFSSQQSHVYDTGSPVEFVHELHRRWLEKHPRSAKTQVEEAPSDWIRGCVFISYASEDRVSAFRLANELVAAGIEVWIDRRLSPGDDFNARVRFYIKECSAFVAVLSQNTNIESGPGRYIGQEWFEACEVNKRFTGQDRRFLFPVIVDGSSPGSLRAIQKEVFGTSATAAPGGEPPQELVRELDRAQKAFRKGAGRA
jgi:hypothetical protein